MCAPGSMVLEGPMVTKYEMRVVDSLRAGSVSLDGDGDDDRLDEGGGAPITAFSQMMQPSPTTIGPS